MKKLAIISEFNPFHNGHEYLVKEAIKKTGAEIAISLMSGDFVQRGEPAIIDKFRRADSAMGAGFDMVVEMPIHITLQSAEYFALGSVKILEKIGIDYLVFGIENTSPEDFLAKVDILIENSDRLEELTKAYMENNSFTKARYDATVEILGDKDFITSNNILALEYIRAIRKINARMVPVPINRLKSANKDIDLDESMVSSSTAIRKNIDGAYKDHVPAYSYDLIEDFRNTYDFPTMDYYYEIFKFLLIMERRPMAGIMGYEEGLENYLLKIAREETSFDTFIEKATSKRYTASRIKRLILNYILENKSAFNIYQLGFYKVLAFNEKAETVLRTSLSKPIVSKADSDSLSFTDQMIYSQMIDASNLYSLALGRELNLDFTTKIGRS